MQKTKTSKIFIRQGGYLYMTPDIISMKMLYAAGYFTSICLFSELYFTQKKKINNIR